MKKKSQKPKSQKAKSKPQNKSNIQKPIHKPVEVKTLVCLLGDEQIVKEYSSAFQDKGISVVELKNLASLKTSAKKITFAFELTLEWNDEKKKNLQALDQALAPDISIISSAVTETVLSQSQGLLHKERIIGIGAFPTLIQNHLVEICPSLYTASEPMEKVKKFFESIKKETGVIQDSIGMVMPRILCQIINEALFVVNYDIAFPKDIDTAMKYGTNYPQGPVEWGEQIGFKNIVTVLDALHKNYAEERYRVAPLLRQMAIAGKFWQTE